MVAADRRLVTIGLIVLAAACGDYGSTPSAPNEGSGSKPTPPIAGPAQIPANFPAPTGPSRVFVFRGALDYPVRSYTTESRFVLYDNGAFSLQYGSGLGFQYLGRYAETNGRIEFAWQGWSTAGPWGATGKLSADSLAVRYNTIMMLSDFEDALYVR
jgi:hypothetical protein